MITRQRIIGWVLIVVSTAYIVYFLRMRFFSAGPIITGKEWFQFVASLACVMIGTANVRLAAMREQGRKAGPPS